MRLIDESPSLFITICFVVLYATVAVESVMLVAGSIAFMFATFAGVVLVAAGICAWMYRLLDDGAAPVEPVAVAAEPAPVPVPEPVLVAERPVQPIGALILS
jgi:hypothetical protein